MTTANSGRGYWATIIFLAALGIPGVVMRFAGIHLFHPGVDALIFGIGIIGGAFLLSWAAEVAQLDVSASFAIAVLALIAVLPEYTIEAVLAWDAGVSFIREGMPDHPTLEMQLAAANVTGANRLLTTFGWSLVILLFWFKRRRYLDMRGLLNLELPMLLAAIALTIAVFLFRAIPIWLAVVFIGAYIFYLWRSSTQEVQEPELHGPAAMIGGFSTAQRRLCVLLLFLYSAAVIIIAAPPFVHGLEDTGKALGFSEFLIIQWIAPLASESPEIIVAALFSLRAHGDAGLTTLISSQVNQLTLLVGSIVVVFNVSAFVSPDTSGLMLFNFPMDELQSSEFLLTALTALFGLMLLAARKVQAWHGVVLFVLGAAYLLILLVFLTGDIENPTYRYIYSAITFGLTVLLVAFNWRRVIYVVRGVPAPEGADADADAAHAERA